MGPFPHDAPRAEITEENPAGTDGFEFVEFAQRLRVRVRELDELKAVGAGGVLLGDLGARCVMREGAHGALLIYLSRVDSIIRARGLRDLQAILPIRAALLRLISYFRILPA